METSVRIAAGLEQIFASEGFAEPSVSRLRDAAGVSLRTLYKYAPSRDEMVYLALEHRHQRYLSRLFRTPLPMRSEDILDTLIDRIADWMRSEASVGCLFHAAVATAPDNARLREILTGHKAEIMRRAAELAGRPDCERDIGIIFEGMI